MMVLVVDDVNTMRVQIKELLRSFGFKNIKSASNGEEAKEILKNYPIHLVLSDWYMAPGDGLDLLYFIRRDESLKHMPFIMVTAEKTKEKVMQAINVGVDDYLSKPLTIQQIHTKIYNVLVKKQVLS